MRKTSTLIKSLGIALIGSLAIINVSKSQSFTEEFEDITTLSAAGWEIINMSNPVGTTDWFQGNPTALPSYSMAGYIGANFNNTTGTGTISNWLLSPTITFNNGDSITFYLSTIDSAAQVLNGGPYPDRIQLLLSTNGSSNNVGADEFSVGDFTTTLFDINPTYSTSGYPIGFPFAWTQLSAEITGLAGPTSGRFAFRYFVENGGPTGSNSNYIGIDLLNYVAMPVGIAEIHNTSKQFIGPNPVIDHLSIFLSEPLKADASLKILNSVGQVVYTTNLTKGFKTEDLNLSFLATGYYNVFISGNDINIRKAFVKD